MEKEKRARHWYYRETLVDKIVQVQKSGEVKAFID